MKISRLLGIVTLLLNRERMTAKELAQHFEVSTRTILRDLEALDEAGIPVVTTQGQGGGVGLMEGFTLDRQYLSVAELASIFTALEGLSKVIHEPEYKTAHEKLKNLVSHKVLDQLQGEDRIINIDMAPWSGSGRLNDNLNILIEAAQAKQRVMFCYSNMKGECTQREVEPYQLSYKGNVWYLFGFCRLRNDFRVFRLSRIKRLEKLTRIFSRKDVPNQDDVWDDITDKHVDLVLRFDPSIRYRVEDFFDEDQIQEQEDGALLVHAGFPEDEWVYSYILSFGSSVEVISPERIRDIIYEKSKACMGLYEPYDNKTG